MAPVPFTPPEWKQDASQDVRPSSAENTKPVMLRELTVDPEAREERRCKRARIRESICNQGAKVRDRKNVNEEVKIVDKGYFIGIVSVIASLNMFVVGLEVDRSCSKGWLNCSYDKRMNWYLVENVFTFLFLVEIAIRIAVGGKDYFKGDPIVNTNGFHFMNCVDFTVVLLRVIDTWILQPSDIQTVIKIISCFRILHLSELVRRAHNMQGFRELWMIFHGVWNAGRVVLWTLVVMFLILYITAIIMTNLVVKDGDPERFDYSMSAWEGKPWTVYDYWGSVPQSLFSLFQIVTLDHWSSTLVRPLVEQSPSYMILFIPFLGITVMSLLNVIVAVIVESTLASAAVNEEKVSRDTAQHHARIMASLKDIFEDADTDGSGELDKDELAKAYTHGHVRDRLKVIQLEYSDLQTLFDLLDQEGTGNVSTEKFFRGCTRLRGPAMSRDLHTMSIDFGRYMVWCGNLTDDYATMNERLAGLLADIDGLDRDVVKGRYDGEDPVLLNRRERYQRVGDPLLDRIRDEHHMDEGHDHHGHDHHGHGHHGHDHHGHGHADEENHSNMSGSQENRKFSKRTSSKHSITLVGNTLKKHDIGKDLCKDLNDIRQSKGMERRLSLVEEYDQDLAQFAHDHVNDRKSTKESPAAIEDAGAHPRTNMKQAFH